MEYEHLVVSHSLLSHDDFLAAVDDEIATLVVLTVLATPDSLSLVEIGQLAELGPQHDGDFAYEDASLFELLQGLLDLPLALASLVVEDELVIQFLLGQEDVDVEFSSVGQVADPCLMGEHWHVSVVFFDDPGVTVDVRLIELYLVDDGLFRVVLLA